MARKSKIAVIGGGMGSLSTVWHLTEDPNWRDHYEITVYQLGWRLGGKGASAVNVADHHRNEEHGLHLMFGFYQNALPMLRALYAELGRAPGTPLATFEEAFTGHDTITLLDRKKGPDETPWVFEMPTRSDADPLRTPAEFCVEILERMADTANERKPGSRRGSVLSRLADVIGAGMEESALGGAISFALDVARRVLQRPVVDAGLRAGFSAAASTLQRAVQAMLYDEADVERRHKLILLDLAASVLKGMASDFEDLRKPDWFSIDDRSFEQWLRHHGATPDTIYSPPVGMLKEIAFSHDIGMGAGTTLHYAMRMTLAYSGSFYYRMQAGMGDTIFAPLYQVLKRRGVQFRFFHRVDEMEHDASGISAINVGRQVTLRGAEYAPLIDVDGLPVWPATPDFAQLREGEALRASGQDLENAWNTWPDADKLRLRRGRDFDVVVLGASLGAVRHILSNQLDDPSLTPLRRMVDEVRTTDIVASQLWIRRDLEATGWPPPMPLAGGMAEPFDTFADMSQLLQRERWPDDVQLLAYHCGGLDDDGEVPPPTEGSGQAPADGDWWARQMARGRASLDAWLSKEAGTVFPGIAAPGGGIDLDALSAPEGAHGLERIASQYWHTPRNPSDRYVQSAPGTVDARLAPWQSGIDNLFFTGDWVLNSYSAGCLEATVMAGMMCAQALIGMPVSIKNDWLPLARPEPYLGRPQAPYVYLDGGGIPSAPYTAEGVDLSVFLLRADMAKLQAICDQRLNLPGNPWTYRPLLPYVMHVCAELPQVATTDPLFWAEERDYGFWMPLAIGKMVDGEFMPERFAFFLPYLWVDVGMAISAGREIFGYPKSLGRLSTDDPDRPEVRFAIDAQVVERWGGMGRPSSKLDWKRLVEVTGPKQRDAEDLDGEGGPVRALLAMMAAAILAEGEAADLRLIETIFGMDGITIPLVFFKQFQCVTSGTLACYSAVTESPNPITKGPFVTPLLGDWSVKINRFASVDLIGNLGLRADDEGVISPTLSVRARFDFRCDPGKVVFSR